MKKRHLALLMTMTLGLSQQVYAQDFLSKLKDSLGQSSSETKTTESESSTFSISQLVSTVSENLNVSEEQSEGGLASIFNGYVLLNCCYTVYEYSR